MAPGNTQIRAGTILGGDYVIEPAADGQLEIGSGAMGNVYLARDRVLDRLVVIKTLKTSAIRTRPEREEFLARFRKEAAAAANCAHPTIITLYRACEPDASGLAWYAMEHVEGAVDLTTRHAQVTAEGEFMAFDELRGYLVDAASALREVHRNGIVHRDIKPQNFLVFQRDDRWHLKLLDFGVAHLPNSEQTSTGHMLGTPDYLSPERARALIIGKRIEPAPSDDLFALGVTAYRLLTNQKPFSGDKTIESLNAIISSTPPRIRDLRPEVPQGLEYVVMRLLEPRLDDRYTDARKLIEDLGRIDELGPYKPSDRPRSASPEAPTNPLAPIFEDSTNPPQVADLLGGDGSTSSGSVPGPELRGAAGEFAAMDARTASASPFSSLPKKTRVALLGGAALVLVLVVLFLSSLGGSGGAELDGEPLVDADAVRPRPQEVTPEQLLALQRRAEDERLLSDEREQRAALAAATAPHAVPDAAGAPVATSKRPARVRPPQGGPATGAAGARDTDPAAAAPARRVKRAEDMLAIAPSEPAGAAAHTVEALGIAMDTRMEVRLLTEVSSETPNTLVTAVLERAVPINGGTTLAAGTKFLGRADFRFDTKRIEITFTKLQTPGSTAIREIAAVAITAKGQAGLVAEVKKRDERAKANAGEAVIDAVESVIGDAPGSRAASRYTGDERQDAQALRERTTVLRLPLNKKISVQFVKAA